MSFLETVASAKAYLCEHGRVSLRGLKREFGLDDEALDALIEELVDIQQVAAREGKAIAWMGSTLPAREAGPADAAAPAAGERRQLTVMFCDLVGSTELSQRLDAEDLRSILRAYQQAAAEVIERYEGHVAQYLGDGLLVYFGYPRAHEEDVERAVRAGREILTALGSLNERLEPEQGVRLAVRIGIHTGPVVIGAVGAGARSETLALGDTTNIAARLEGVAEPDTVVISEATLRLVPGLFVTKDLGTRAVKGVGAPMRAYAVLQVTGVRSRLEVDPSRLTPLVGREREVGLLLERWEQVHEGRGQALLIAGEAGLGKSRLLQAFRERLAAEPHGWLECRCTPYTQRSAFHPLVELLEQGLGFKAGDDPETKLGRLERGVAAAELPVPEGVALIAPLLSLSLPERHPPLQQSPELQRKNTIEALVAWILRLGEQQPVVMLVEDLHWCDPSTVELLGRLLEQSHGARVLTLLTFRASFETPWPARSHVTQLAMKRLSRRQAHAMIRGMTRDRSLPDAVVERIVERADGIPLFVEELTKMLLESGLLEEQEGRYELKGPLTEIEIPATLQGSLMARLDRLPEGKGVAQLGAALGREFAYELLRAASPVEALPLQKGLDQLVDAELVYERGVPPEATYTFKHAMIQDTAYRSLLKSVRQEFHARIAHVLEERFPERVASEPEVIARHCAEGGLTEKAIAHYQRAGQRATERSANQEAIGHLGRALELLGTLPESSERNQQELGLQLAIASPLSAARGWSDPEAESAFERARELASQIGEVPELPRALVGVAVAYYIKGDLATSAELAREALGAAERMGSDFDLLSAHYAVGCPLYWRGETSQALQHLEQASALYDPETHGPLAYSVGIDRGVVSLNYAASGHWARGQPDRALATIREAVALAQRVAHPLSLVTAFGWEAWIHQLRREQDQTLLCADKAIALSEELGFPLFLGLGRALHGWALATSRGDPQGVAEIEGALASLAQSGTGIGAPQILGSLAEAYEKVGRHDDALRALELGLVRAREQGQHYYDAELHRLRAGVLLDADAGSGEEAEDVLRRALEISHSQQARSFELRAAMSLARLWQRQGKGAEARELLQPVYDGFTEGFATQDLIDAKALLGELA